MRAETKKRIEAYKSCLPGMRERVVAAALMFAIALSMVVSATFAWITISTSPEIKAMETSISANGSLEIALAHDNGRILPTSGRGDSSAVDNDYLRANITWGNLINLSDPKYGLSSITLRPASLTGVSGLLNSPLYGVTYGADGRVIKNTSEDDFAYCYYDAEHETFNVDLANNHYGVRAISTVTYINLEGESIMTSLKGTFSEKLNSAKNGYSILTNQNTEPGRTYIEALKKLVITYGQAQLDGINENTVANSKTEVTAYVTDLADMMVDLYEDCYIPLAEAYYELAKMSYLKENGNIDDFENIYDVATLCNQAKNDELPTYMNEIAGLKSFAVDRNYLISQLDATKQGTLAYYGQQAKNGTKVYWKDIKGFISWAVDTDSCQVDGKTFDELIAWINKNMISNGLSFLNASSHTAVIFGGALYRTEYRIGQYFSPTLDEMEFDFSSRASVLGKKSIKNTTVTTAANPISVNTKNSAGNVSILIDRDTILEGVTTFKGSDATAEDTYALALDFWLRTNAGTLSGAEDTVETVTDDETGQTKKIVTKGEQAFITLEGSVRKVTIEKSETKRISIAVGSTTKQIDAEVYKLTITHNGKSYETEACYVESVSGQQVNDYYLIKDIDIDLVNEGVTTFHRDNFIKSLFNYYSISAGNYTVDGVKKVSYETVVVGYDGVNRIWSEDEMTSYMVENGTSTTQGKGSCYTFYASNEADQKRFLKLLGAMKVVFVNSAGRMIGRANMDVDNCFAESGKTVVPLVLDKTTAIYLGQDINGEDIYGMMSLDKNIATRVSAIIYLDGTQLSNTMVLASGDIQGSLNIQFGSVTASKTITTISEYNEETQEDEVILEDEGYSQIGYLAPIENNDLMEDYVAVSASVSKTEFDYNGSAVSTTVNVQTSGSEPQSVSVRFTRAINSTQGVLQQMQSLTKSGDNWTGGYSFAKPGTYILRSVYVDGVEYDLANAITVIVNGSNVTSVSCDAIPNGTYAQVMTANTKFSTKIVLGFSTSNVQPRTVRGFFLNDDGSKTVSVVFSLIGSGNWQGNAVFGSSGTYTMKYVEIDGDQYDISETIRPTLDIKLGLKVRTWIAVSDETRAKLEAIDATATATRFTLDTAAKDEDGNPLLNITGEPGSDVTLEVSAAVYDNSGQAITGLDNIVLVYGKNGSAIKKLDCNMVWDGSIGRYVGEFLVTEAGTYKFTRLTAGSNVITAVTNAPNIQVLPPEDAYYFNNYTPDYILEFDGDAAATIGIAYSNAASRITGTFVGSNGIEYEVEGVMGGEAEDQGDKSVNLWSFAVPVVNGTQDGIWTLKSINMYGVYYNTVYYDDENPANVDLSFDNITFKVVNTIYSIFSGTSANYTGYFMDDHNTNFELQIVDYENEALEGVTIDNISLVYTLNSNNLGIDSEYGYDLPEGSATTVAGTGTLKAGTDSTYEIKDLNFQLAGEYKTCSISFKINGKIYTVGGTGTKYYDGGNLSESYPKYTVKWAAPTITLTALSPAPGIANKFTSSKSGDIAFNYLSDYEANMYHSFVKSSSLLGISYDVYDFPELSMKLSDMGSKSFNVTLNVPLPDDANSERSYSFNKNNQTVKTEIGSESSASYGLGGTRTISGGKWNITQIPVVYNGYTYNMKLSHAIEIRENYQQQQVPYLTYEGFEDYPGATAPADHDKGDGLRFTVKLPSIPNFVNREYRAGEEGEPTVTTSTTTVGYANGTVKDGCNTVTAYNGYNRTTEVYTSQAEQLTVDVTYKIVKWKIYKMQGGGSWDAGTLYNVGTSVTVTGTWKAEPVFEEVSSTVVTSTTSTHVVTYVTDVLSWEKTKQKPGTVLSGISEIHTSKYMISDEWR